MFRQKVRRILRCLIRELRYCRGFGHLFESCPGANLNNAVLTDVRSGGINGSPIALPSNWQLASGYLIGPGADLSSAILSYENLTDANLTGATLNGARLVGANLTGANLAGADLGIETWTNWKTVLTGANLTDVISGGITGSPSALPDNWQLASGYLIGPRAYLDGANLTGANLSDVNLANANLHKAALDDADLGGANLTDANLSGVSSGGITGNPGSLPATWQLISGYLIGPGANLGGADLSGANLYKADLDYADLRFANLSNANLNWADLSGANLYKAFLSNADLANADLYKANLTGASLADAVLIGASFSYGTILFDGQTVLEHGFDAASLKNYLVESQYTSNATNLTIVPEPTTLLLALLALVAAPLRVRCG